jgi:hypothetical protein
MKVIFLDIDGVLNVNHRERDDYGSAFHDNFVENLKRIIDSTGAKIVVSSSWRQSGLDAILEMWDLRKLPGEVIDVTTSIRLQRGMIYFHRNISDHEKSRYRGYSLPRGLEIDYWLKEDGGLDNIYYQKEWQVKNLEKSKVKNYVIIDDDADMLFGQAPHFVKCSGNHDHLDSIEGLGLTSKCADKAIEILNTNYIDLHFK